MLQTLSASVDLTPPAAPFCPHFQPLGQVVAVLRDVLPVLDEPVADGLLGVGGPGAQLRHTIDHVAHQVEAVDVVPHAHVEGRARGALFLVAAHVEIRVAVAPASTTLSNARCRS